MAQNSGKNRRVASLSRPAEKDYFAIFAYTAQQWGEDQAREYKAFLSSSMQQLADNPALAAFVPGMGTVRSYTVRWKNAQQGHRIFFEESETGIVVFRILHTAMNWKQHFES